MKRILAALALAAITATSAHAQGQRTKITLGYTGVIDYLAAFVAADQGIFEKHGLDVTLQRMPNGASIPPGLLANSLQIGGITAPVLIQAKAGGFPMKVVAGGSVVIKENPNGWVVARTNSGIKEPKDFVGKRVGAGAVGSYFNVLFREWLHNNGVDPQRVTYVEVPFPQTADVLKAGQIDAATIGEPYVSRIVKSDIGYVVSPYTGTFEQGLLSNIYTATDAWVQANPQAPKAFRAALDEAITFIQNSPEKARESAAKHLKLTPEVLAETPLANYRTDVVPTQVQAWNNITRRHGLIDRDIDPKSVLLP